jgi:hypothetical protein
MFNMSFIGLNFLLISINLMLHAIEILCRILCVIKQKMEKQEEEKRYRR